MNYENLINNYKQHIVMHKYPFWDDYAMYYSDMGASCYDMFLLGNLLGYLRIKYPTNKDIIHDLENRNFISVAGDLDYFSGRYNSGSKMLEIHGEYVDFMDQAYFERLFPQEKDKDFLEYYYKIPLFDFLQLAEKMRAYFESVVLWIVIYEDAKNKVHLEEYEKSLDYGEPFTGRLPDK